MADRASAYIVRVLGTKLAADLAVTASRTVFLVDHPHDQFDILDVGICSVLAFLVSSYVFAHPEKSDDECLTGIVEEIRSGVTAAFDRLPPRAMRNA